MQTLLSSSHAFKPAVRLAPYGPLLLVRSTIRKVLRSRRIKDTRGRFVTNWPSRRSSGSPVDRSPPSGRSLLCKDSSNEGPPRRVIDTYLTSKLIHSFHSYSKEKKLHEYMYEDYRCSKLIWILLNNFLATSKIPVSCIFQYFFLLFFVKKESCSCWKGKLRNGRWRIYRILLVISLVRVVI